MIEIKRKGRPNQRQRHTRREREIFTQTLAIRVIANNHRFEYIVKIVTFRRFNFLPLLYCFPPQKFEKQGLVHQFKWLNGNKQIIHFAKNGLLFSNEKNAMLTRIVIQHFNFIIILMKLKIAADGRSSLSPPLSSLQFSIFVYLYNCLSACLSHQLFRFILSTVNLQSMLK